MKTKAKIQTLTPFMKNVEYKYQPQGLGMLFIGRFVVEKGIFVILEAAKLLKEYKFTFIGDGPLRAEIEEFILKNNMKNVKLKPWLNDEALQSEIIKYDAAVIPSIWYETVGIIVLEVGAKGIPSIISDNSVMCEIIEDKVDGLIFKMGDKDDLIDKIHYFYAEKERKFQLSQKMFTKITEKYNIINFYNNILNIYNKEIRKII